MCYNADVSNGNSLVSFHFFFTFELHIAIYLMNILSILCNFQRDNNIILLAISLVQLGWSSSLTFIPCELSERICLAFENVYETIIELDWYVFPIGMQKMLSIVLIISQDPIALRCFGSIYCGREVFKKVCRSECKFFFYDFFFGIFVFQMNNKSFSFFMVLRQFNK